MLGPYLRSVILRDASVTTWLRAALAPIDGRIATELPAIGSRIGPDGHVATIHNQLLLHESRTVEDTRDRMISSQSRIAEAKEYMADLEQLDLARIVERDRHVEVFHDQLETEIANLRGEMAINAERIEVLTRIEERNQALVDRGTGSVAAYDEAVLRLAEMKLHQAQLEATLDYTLLRDRSAEDGVYITPDGGAPDWVRQGELELRLELRRTRHELHSAESALAEAKKDLVIERQTLEGLGRAPVTAPPGSVVFSVVAVPAAAVSTE
jgi:hypothetical protein